jgi:DUF1680 family protein
VNGSPVKPKIEHGYAVIDRSWKAGDVIELELPMKIQRIRATDRVTTEWRGDLLGGVVVIEGTFADGSPMVAIPNYARMNREPAPPPIASVVWINERAT